MDAMIEFYQSIPAFNQLPRLSLENLLEKSVKRKFERKQFVYKENDLTAFVYIVWKGEFELSRNLPKKKLETSGINQLLNFKPELPKQELIISPPPEEVPQKKTIKK